MWRKLLLCACVLISLTTATPADAHVWSYNDGTGQWEQGASEVPHWSATVTCRTNMPNGGLSNVEIIPQVTAPIGYRQRTGYNTMTIAHGVYLGTWDAVQRVWLWEWLGWKNHVIHTSVDPAFGLQPALVGNREAWVSPGYHYVYSVYWWFDQSIGQWISGDSIFTTLYRQGNALQPFAGFSDSNFCVT